MPTAQELAAQVSSTNETAKSTTATIIAYLAIAAYLSVSVAGTDSEQLLLNGKVNFPILNAGVPCRLFYILSPLLLLILHTYLLLEIYFLSQKVRYLLQWQRAERVPPVDVSQHITTLTVAIGLGSPVAWYVKVIVPILFFFINVLLPIALLLAMQIKFLPYHDWGVTWWQRIILFADVGLVALFFFNRGIGQARASRLDLATEGKPVDTRSGPRLRSQIRHWARVFRKFALYPAAVLIVMMVALLLSLGRIVVPDGCFDPFDEWSTRHGFQLPHRALAAIIDPYLNLAGKVFPTGSGASGRDLRCADFRNASLQGFNFRGSILTGANFDRADLTKAKFGLGLADDPAIQLGRGTDPAGRRGESDPRDEEPSCDAYDVATSDRTDLRHVSFEQAHLNGADFSYSQLDQAQLRHAQMTGADFSGARADEADFTDARGGGTVFNSACLRGATLLRAHLKESRFYRAHVEVASLIDAHLESSEFFGAALVGSDMRRAWLQGAKGLSLQGVDLRHANLSDIDFLPPPQDTAEPEGAETQPQGSQIRAGAPPINLQYADLRDAVFTDNTSFDVRAGNLLYRKDELPPELRKVAPEPLSDDEFYRQLTFFLVGSRPDLVPYLAKVAARADESSKFDVTVACGIMCERERRLNRSPSDDPRDRDPRDRFFSDLSAEQLRSLARTARNCSVLLASPLKSSLLSAAERADSHRAAGQSSGFSPLCD